MNVMYVNCINIFIYLFLYICISKVLCSNCCRMVSDSRNPMMLEASPLPVHALAASHGVSIRAAWRTGQELWGT